METADNGIPGKYRGFNSNSEQKMNPSVYRKSSKSKEQKPLNRKSPTPVSYTKCSENAGYHFQSFAENASLDGIKFVGEKGRTIPERIFWTITMIVALALCVILVAQTFKKWINSPVIVTFATTQTPIFQIPFPAITICPEIKSDRVIFNYTDAFLKKSNNLTMDESEKTGFNYMSLICDPPADLLDNDTLLTDQAAIDYFKMVSPNFDDSVLNIEWKGHDFDNNGTGLFSTTLTGAGVCYTFNALDRNELFTDIVSYQEGFFSNNGTRSEWFLQTGYSKDANIDAYPRRTMVAGAKGGLSLILFTLNSNLDYACGDSLQGFKVALHHPGELPRVNQNFFRMPLEQTIVAAVKPNMMTTMEDLKGYTPKDRQCYFESEKNLKFFKIYNQQNCLVECLANFTLKYCECVSFHMPKEKSTPICGAASMECMDSAEVLFLEDEVNHKIKYSKRSKLRRKDLNLEGPAYSDRCDCLPACTSLDYDVELSQSNWNWQEAFNILKLTKNWDEDLNDILEDNSVHLTRLQIFFKEMQFITSERNELYGSTDFWANIGGIIGLFTGFSFITMFEIFYYLSLRLFCNVRLFGRRYWSGAPELLEETKIESDRNKNV